MKLSPLEIDIRIGRIHCLGALVGKKGFVDLALVPLRVAQIDPDIHMVRHPRSGCGNQLFRLVRMSLA